MSRITSFKFKPGDLISKKYEVISRLGKGWEAEVYLVKEKGLHIERAIKIFFPHRNKKNKVASYHAKKLHKLKSCRALIQYHTMEVYEHKNIKATYLVSEYIKGDLLDTFVKRQPGKRLHPFQALHLFYTLVCALEEVHALGEYHGDLHTENIIISRNGLHFDIKFVDFFHWKEVSKRTNIKDDIVALVDMLYEVLGGADHYAKQPDAIKGIILGKRRDRIRATFPTISKLKKHIQDLEW